MNQGRFPRAFGELWAWKADIGSGVMRSPEGQAVRERRVSCGWGGWWPSLHSAPSCSHLCCKHSLRAVDSYGRASLHFPEACGAYFRAKFSSLHVAGGNFDNSLMQSKSSVKRPKIPTVYSFLFYSILGVEPRALLGKLSILELHP